MTKINKEAQAVMPQKLLQELLDYDGLTGAWTNKTNRGSRARKGQPAGCLDKSTGYVQIYINGYKYYAHRLAWVYKYGDFPEGEQPFIDHINGKRDDNRIENLKISSSGENSKNRYMMSNNKSGVTGINRTTMWNGSKNKELHYWRATWCDENGKLCGRIFSVEKLGEDQAKQMAIAHRVEQLRLLEANHGVIYNERHGEQVKGK